MDRKAGNGRHRGTGCGAKHPRLLLQLVKAHDDCKGCGGAGADTEKSKAVPKAYFLFTATEFAPELVKLAKKDERFILVDMKQL